jgi:hypothetical protein
MKKILFLSMIAPTLFAADADLEQLKLQIQQLQDKVQTIEMNNAKKEQESLDTKVANDTSSSFSQNAYLPDIGLVLDMSALSRNVNNTDYANQVMAGFYDNTSNKKTDLPFNSDRGFNLNYAEVSMHSVVDPYFDVFAVFHIHPNAMEIEEAYVRTRALPYSLLMKAGKFKSDFGRINAKHQHSWAFSSQPLIYAGLFGADGISDPGIQLQWMVPTSTYVMAGVEAMQGTNSQSFGNTEGNSLYVGYLKSSADLTDTISVLGGMSGATAKNPNGKTNVYGADVTLRADLGSYSSLTWQSEYLNRDMDNVVSTKDKQSGVYTELIYNIDENWAMGARYDRILDNQYDQSSNVNNFDTHNMDRTTLMLQYKPFEFSRLRLEYTNDRSKIIDGSRKDIQEVMLNLTIEAGSHGAHAY